MVVLGELRYILPVMQFYFMFQKLCGLLNNNEDGSMFFGLSADSIIEGLKLGREDKDVFRNGNVVYSL
jgi:hypothetical protein